ncbi:MAG: hypothetical protein K1X81_10610 [Bacteroidia bacterium]|nr:hypothetical protein [Bacteroidia bacterium]
MDKDFEKKYHHFEKKQWWLTTGRIAIHHLLKSFIKPEMLILDIGCSGGVLIHESKYAAVEVLEIDVSEVSRRNKYPVFGPKTFEIK